MNAVSCSSVVSVLKLKTLLPQQLTTTTNRGRRTLCLSTLLTANLHKVAPDGERKFSPNDPCGAPSFRLLPRLNRRLFLPDTLEPIDQSCTWSRSGRHSMPFSCISLSHDDQLRASTVKMSTLFIILVVLQLAIAAPMEYIPHDRVWVERYHQSWPQLLDSPDGSEYISPFATESPSLWHASSPSEDAPSPQYPAWHNPNGGSAVNPIDVDRESTPSIPSDASEEKRYSPPSSVRSTARQATPAIFDSSAFDQASVPESSATDTKKPGRTFWWEPASIRKLDVLPPLRRPDQRIPATLIRNPPDADLVRNEINTRLFANRIQWISDADLATLSGQQYRNMWPIKRTSRPLPVEVGAEMKVYMTQHNGLKESDALMAGPLTKHHYLFWGVKETRTGTNVMGYGGVWFDTADHGVVNAHLQPLIRAWREARRARR